MICTGEIYIADLGPIGEVTNEERGQRPVLVVSSELHNTVNKTVIVVPLTTQTKNAHWHEHLLVKTDCFADKSVVMCEHIRELDKSKVLGSPKGTLCPADMTTVLNIIKQITLG